MITPYLFQSATVVHRSAQTTSDSEGNTVFNAPASTTYPANLQQVTRTEIIEGERRAVSTLILFLPPTAVVVSEDQVVISGSTYQVEGPPNLLSTIRGPHHIEATLNLTVS